MALLKDKQFVCVGMRNSRLWVIEISPSLDDRPSLYKTRPWKEEQYAIFFSVDQDFLKVESKSVLLCTFKDILNGKFNKHLQPSSTVPEWRAKENDLRLLLTNGRIIKYVK